MPFPHFHSDFGRESLKRSAELAITTHGQHEDSLNEEARKLRKQKHTGIELSGPELAYLQHDLSEKIGTLRNKISELGRSVDEGSAPNPFTVGEDLRKYRQELAFLEHNFIEKLFTKVEDADNEAAL